MRSRIRYYSDTHISLGRLWWGVPLRNNQGIDEPVQSDYDAKHFCIFQFCSFFIYVFWLVQLFLNVIYGFIVVIVYFVDVFSYTFRFFDIFVKASFSSGFVLIRIYVFDVFYCVCVLGVLLNAIYLFDVFIQFFDRLRNFACDFGS